ncbi:hypothetical protein [Pseudoalteromonas prydzensis]|uniref:hypothetical protein n=1 Tax=Pseudoalteromonas prydzensis TaxID=182141 RepID=UPI0007E4EA75|nr:hypothetical protein [Pseudoalteromonas prydzensis]MBE0379088.1 hypothetical protein [Pseudoalteromonas prydzensis ACAM 620]
MHRLVFSLLLISNIALADDWQHSKENEWTPMGIEWDKVEDEFYTAAERKASKSGSPILPRSEYRFYSKAILINSEKVIALRAACKSQEFQNGAAIEGGGTCYILGVYQPQNNQVRGVRFNAPY